MREGYRDRRSRAGDTVADRRPTLWWARSQARDWRAMAVRDDCRHYATRTTATGEVMQRCRLGANEDMPFACPTDCLFFEPRSITGSGWTRESGDDSGEDDGLYR